ncbi:unnamed protein product [Clavelina lepadiformis]|uniref:C2H2-type domain-containing protein n=1 Tax=Clavelina lepadiformis TaxID=159417 RepID=A0ABP0GVA3_CLALP
MEAALGSVGDFDNPSAKFIAIMVLQELKAIRKDMNREIKRLSSSIEQLFSHFDASSAEYCSDYDLVQTEKDNVTSIVENSELQLPGHNKTTSNNDDLASSLLEVKRPLQALQNIPENPIISADSNNGKNNLQIDCVEIQIIQNENMDPASDEVSNFFDSCEIYESDQEHLSDEQMDESNVEDDDVAAEVKEEEEYILEEIPQDSYSVRTSENNCRQLRSFSKLRSEKHNVQCDICDKVFDNPNNFKSHYARHVGPFKCKICSKELSTKGGYKTHLLIHKNIRPHQCNQCDKAFFERAALRFHMRANHTGERPFACKLCGKAFVRKGNLTGHMVLHSGERPFRCEVCEKTFNRKSNLKLHMQVHIPDRAEECGHCDRSYIDKEALRKHRLKAHGIKSL